VDQLKAADTTVFGEGLGKARAALEAFLLELPATVEPIPVPDMSEEREQTRTVLGRWMASFACVWVSFGIAVYVLRSEILGGRGLFTVPGVVAIFVSVYLYETSRMLAIDRVWLGRFEGLAGVLEGWMRTLEGGVADYDPGDHLLLHKLSLLLGRAGVKLSRVSSFLDMGIDYVADFPSGRVGFQLSHRLLRDINDLHATQLGCREVVVFVAGGRMRWKQVLGFEYRVLAAAELETYIQAKLNPD